MPLCLSSVGNNCPAAAPAGVPSVRPTTSLSVLTGPSALVMSAKGGVLYIMKTMAGCSPGLVLATWMIAFTSPRPAS